MIKKFKTRKEEIAWAIGIVEGEGSVGNRIDRNTRTPRIKVSMTDVDTIEKLHSIFGGTYSYTKPKNPRHQGIWEWSLNKKKEVYTVLCIIYPFMSRRRKGKIDEVLTRYRNAGGLD